MQSSPARDRQDTFDTMPFVIYLKDSDAMNDVVVNKHEIESPSGQHLDGGKTLSAHWERFLDKQKNKICTKRCFNCGVPKHGTQLKGCSRCPYSGVLYCSKDCQAEHWKKHKTYCNKYQEQFNADDSLEELTKRHNLFNWCRLHQHELIIYTKLMERQPEVVAQEKHGGHHVLYIRERPDMPMARKYQIFQRVHKAGNMVPTCDTSTRRPDFVLRLYVQPHGDWADSFLGHDDYDTSNDFGLNIYVTDLKHKEDPLPFALSVKKSENLARNLIRRINGGGIPLA